VNLTLFDLDGTLIETDSDHAFGEFMVRAGWADGDAYRRRNDAFYADYLAGRLDQSAYIEFATAPWRDRPVAEIQAGRERFLQEVIAPTLHPRAIELVQRHRHNDDAMAIVTATNEFITRPIAALFGIDALIATELERDARGHVTGAILGVPAYREGKVVRVEQWLAVHGRRRDDFDRINVYGDSINDLPLLEWGTHPVATNPGPALAALARERGWPILNLFQETT
jgi:HAD superfamily hydrolase (TIGR01490 family)